MAEVTVEQLAKTVGASEERLLLQMKEAGLPHVRTDQTVSDDDKKILLSYLKRNHGESSSTPKKITLKRKTLSTLKTGGTSGKKTVNVEIRKKRTYVKRDQVEEEKEELFERDDEKIKKGLNLIDSSPSNETDPELLRQKAAEKRREENEAREAAAKEAALAAELIEQEKQQAASEKLKERDGKKSKRTQSPVNDREGDRRKTKNKVVINAGRDLGLSIGTTFNVIKTSEIKDYSTGETFGIETEKIGKIYLTEIGPNFAKGKIIKGRRLVENGMIIKETRSLQPSYGLSFSGGPVVLDGKINNTVGIFEVSNRFTGSHDIELDYSDNEQIVEGFHFNVSGYMRKLENNYFGGFGLDLYSIEERLGGWTFEGFLNKQIGLLPEMIFISPGISVGFGRLNQKLPGNIVSEISAGYSDNLHSNSLYYSLNINAGIYFGKINVFGEASFQSLNFSDWYYSVKIGNKEEGAEPIKISNDLVPFSEVTIPLSFKLGIKYEL